MVDRSNLEDPQTRNRALAELGQWVSDTCLLFGMDAGSAHRVSFIFVEGLQAEWEDRNPDFHIVR